MQPQIASKKVVYENPFCRLEEWIIQKDGKEFFYGIRNCSDAAVVFALTENDDVVLIREFFITHGEYEYGLPAGLLDSGEEALGAAQRELLEETGYTAKKWTSLGSMLMSKYITGRYHFFLAEGATPVQEQHLEASEDLTVELAPLEKVKEMTENNVIYDTPRLLCAYKALVHLKRI